MPKKAYEFGDVRKFLEIPGQAGLEVLEAFDALVDAAIIFSPIFCGPQSLLLLNVLDVKDRLIKICKVVYSGVVKKNKTDYITRVEQLKAAYALISITAYLELLPNTIPESVVKILKKESTDIKGLLDKSIGTPESILITDYYADHALPFADVKKHLFECYKEASDGFADLIEKASEGVDVKTKGELSYTKYCVLGLPEKAIKNFENQYIGLAIEFNDFALFAQIDMLERLDSVSSENADAIKKITEDVKSIDVGFKRLSDLVNSLPNQFSDNRAKKIVDDLKITYAKNLQKPIIDQSEIKSEDDRNSLVFPKIIDAFIPQSYKSLTYDDEDIKLEDKQVWDSLTEKHDLNNYFIEYLFSPDSIDYPLLILGQPGSGKSLLTKVLSAQLMSDSYTVIRIPLRDVNAKEKISSLVVNQINNDVERNDVEGYADFADHFIEKPLIIILDGFDELLQAKGRVFFEYLDGVREFQETQKAFNRPVRVIVTSRITLIDKAHIPLHSSVLMLMEFDEQKQNEWISIWNKSNDNFFKENDISPFKLPASIKGRNNSILDLAKQPLLLLMLAIYDSDSNELAKNKNIKRTELYDNLIRRFILRERKRYIDDFVNKSSKEKDLIIDEEVKRLGIVAIGMYNRRGVVIRTEQLEADLNLFNAHRTDGSPQLLTLKESESVLGGFFFIHHSKARDLEAHSTSSESAYEFLHNTFGEFLAADFILRNAIDTAINVYRNRECNISLETFIASDWFYCLMLVPLYSRPVVIEMLREHLDRALKNNISNKNLSSSISKTDFVSNLELIVKNQLKMVLNKRKLPDVMSENNLFDTDMSIIGYLSTYSMNLIILMSAFSDCGYAFVETDFYNNSTRENHPWDELVSLWKAWFLLSDLMGLSVVLKAKRVADTEVLVECNNVFESTPYNQPVDVMLCVSHALGDNFLTGLTGLHTNNFNEITGLDNESECVLYSKLSINVYMACLVRMLMRQTLLLCSIEDIINNPNSVNCLNEILIKIHSAYMDELVQRELDYDTCCLVSNAVYYCLSHRIVPVNARASLFEMIYRLGSRFNHFSDRDIYENRILTFDYLNGAPKTKITYRGRNTKRFDMDSFFVKKRYIWRRRSADQFLDKEETEFCDKYIHLFFLLNSKERNVFLNKSFNQSSLNVLLLVKPEVVFYILDTLLESYKKLSRTTIRKITEISQYSLDRVLPLYFSYLNLETITYMLKVAKKINYITFLEQAFAEIRERFNDIETRIGVECLFSNPRVLINLLELLPKEIILDIIDVLECCFDEVYMNRLHSVTEIDVLVDYLRILICIYQSGTKRKSIISRAKKCLKELTEHVYCSVDLTEMTIEQLDILQNCAELVVNTRLLQKIKDTRNI